MLSLSFNLTETALASICVATCYINYVNFSHSRVAGKGENDR